MRIDAKANVGERGQALVMVTLALFAIFGMVALAVDLGWSYFRAKAARTAADTAALAAVKNAFGAPASYQTVALTACATVSDANLQVGCKYAGANDFNYSGNTASSPYPTNANAAVRMQAGTGTYTTATGGSIPTQYWVKAIAAEAIPQLFSGFLGHPTGQASAFGTAAVVKVIVNGALVLLNKDNDCAIFSQPTGSPKTTCGTDLNVQGSGGTGGGNGNGNTYTLQTSGNILLSSTCNNGVGTLGGCSAGASAGMNQGGSIFTGAAGTQIQGAGWYSQNNNGTWQSTPTNGATDGFGDPLANLSQPPVPSASSQATGIAVPTGSGGHFGVLSSSVCNPCGSGSYYAVDSNGVPNGLPIQVSGSVTFNGGSFGQFVFYGGMTGANSSTATFGPGEYVFAGAQASGSGNNVTPGSVLATGTGFSLKDNTTTTNTAAVDAGELFLFTDANYAGLTPPANMSSAVRSSLVYGTVNFQSGNTNSNTINLHGLNVNNLPAGSNLTDYAPELVWQDRGNVYGKTGEPTGAPELDISASPNVHLTGVIYQPEGAWTTLNGGGGYDGPLQIISGALNMQGSAKIDLTAPVEPLTITKVALIE